MATKKKTETKSVLDELFISAYKLRKAGIDASIIETMSRTYLLGSTAAAFELSSETLTEEQVKLVEILKANGFDVTQLNKTLIVKNLHLEKLKAEVDKSFNEE